MSTQPMEALQLRALEQRAQLHKTAADLRDRASQVRDKLRLSKQAREHIVAMSALGGLIGLAAGYGAAGMFVRS